MWLYTKAPVATIYTYMLRTTEYRIYNSVECRMWFECERELKLVSI